MELQRPRAPPGRAAAMLRRLGFAGVQIHAAHGFLLTQFLSLLFNRQTDRWDGSLANRMRVLLETIAAGGAKMAFSRNSPA